MAEMSKEMKYSLIGLAVLAIAGIAYYASKHVAVTGPNITVTIT